jgi:hypothetical protein
MSIRLKGPKLFSAKGMFMFIICQYSVILRSLIIYELA